MVNVLSVSSVVHFLTGEMILSWPKDRMGCRALKMKYGRSEHLQQVERVGECACMWDLYMGI